MQVHRAGVEGSCAALQAAQTFYLILKIPTVLYLFANSEWTAFKDHKIYPNDKQNTELG